jgi:hypothetical protein
MPSQEVSGRTRNERHASRGTSLAGRRQERPVRGPVHGTLDLPAQDGDLVTQDRVLEFGLSC